MEECLMADVTMSDFFYAKVALFFWFLSLLALLALCDKSLLLCWLCAKKNSFSLCSLSS